MTFTFTNYAAIAPRRSPLHDIIGRTLAGYNEATKSKYLKREKEADIFSKQISPLAMLASSPFFSSMQPEQQHQIASYISKMMGQQGVGGQPGQGDMGMGQGAMGQEGGMGGNQQPGGQQQAGYGGDPNSLVPQNPGQHFTGQYTQSPYAGGTAHRGSGGETIYAPTGGNVQKGLDVLTESKGLKKLFDNYAKVAPKVGGAGGFKRDLSQVASGIGKTNLPFSGQISEYLGGATLSNEAASAEAYKNQMAPALRALGFSNPEISQMLRFYPGETEANIKHRLEQTWPVIERKIKTHQKNLKQGINVNNNVIGENDVPRSIEQKMARDEQERSAYEQQGDQEGGNSGEMMLIAPDGSRGFVPAEQAMKLIQSGKFKEAK